MRATQGAFEPLLGAELMLALNAIERAQLDPAEFALEEGLSEGHLAGGGPVVSRLISVKRLSAGVQRQYGSTHGWLCEFELDLRRGVFGRSFPVAPGAFSGATK